MALPNRIFLQLGGEQMITPMPEDFDTLRESGVITWNDEQVNDSDIEYIRNDPKVLLGEVRRRLEINCVNDMWHVWDVEDITPEDLEVKDG
uniref:Uncharacterized protein n=1 Tax=viral metagenome TaxID=1070528 RepID=A0A6H1ZJV0_9ZZZZ